MSSICLTSKLQIANYRHVCDYCGFVIDKGERYHYASGFSDGSAWKWKSHRFCHDFGQAARESMSLWDEGLSPDQWHEHLFDYWLADQIGEEADGCRDEARRQWQLQRWPS